METEEKEEQDWRMMQLPNGSGDRRIKKSKTADKMVATVQLMLSLIKSVVDVGVVLSAYLILLRMYLITYTL